MHPIAFSIGSFQIHMYGVMAAIGFAAGLWMIKHTAKYAKLTKDQGTSVIFVAMIAGIVGARAWHCIEYSVPLQDWVKIWQGGLIFYGGLLTSAIALIIYCKIQKFDLIRVLDIVAPSLAIGHFFGRIGCFWQGCCFGNPTKCAWGVLYPAQSDAARRYMDLLGNSMALHPVQIYEAIINLGLFGLLWFLLPRTKRGVVVFVYIFVYSVVRFALEFFRGDYNMAEYRGGLTLGQVVSLALIPLSLVLVLYFQTREKNSENT